MSPSLLFVATAMVLIPMVVQAEPSPYAAEAGRKIKALSARETEDFLAGKGMGLARAAELNNWPGPAHLLELSEALRLQSHQVEALTGIKARMTEDARVLGRRLVEQEEDLDRNFAGSTITLERLNERSEGIGLLRGQFRAVHLAAHLSAKAILTEDQVQLYSRMQGYQASPAAHQEPATPPNRHQTSERP